MLTLNPMTTTTERSEQLSITGSALDTLRREAVALMPARLCATDAAWVEVTETLRYDDGASSLTPAALARRATASLDAAAAEWAAEQQRD